MKTPSASLFNLIKSLDTQEKVHFKLYASRKSDSNNYVLLFDAIEEQEEYNEQEVKQKLKNQSFIKNLKQAKSYASEVILKSLQEYHSGGSSSAILGNYIQQIEILIRKRLFEAANKLIFRAEKMARGHHKFYHLSILLSQKRVALTAQANREAINEYHLKYYRDEIECLDIIRNQVEYMRLAMLIIRDSFVQYTVPEEKRKELMALLEDPLHQDEKLALSLPARIQFHRNLGNIYALLREKEKSIPHYAAIVNLMDEHPALLDGQMKSYLMGMNNLMVLLKESRRFREHNELFERSRHFMDTLPKKLMNNSIAEVYMMIHTNYISYLLDGLQIDRGIELSQEFSPVVKKHFTEGAFIIFHMNLFLLYFYKGEFKKANRQLNEIEVSSAVVMMRDIVDQGRIFSILTHYEMGNWSLLPGLCKSAERYFIKHRGLSRTQTVLLRFFRKIRPGIRSYPSVTDFQKLMEELKLVLQKENQFTEFDLLSWCESKVRGKNFLDIVREKKGLSSQQ